MDLTCPSCLSTFSCSSSGSAACWCATYPPILKPDPTRSCLCPECLAKTIGQAIEQKLDTLDLDDALAFAHSHRGTSRLPIEHIDYTVENNFTVFTRWYLLKRQDCCGELCTHCPYRD